MTPAELAGNTARRVMLKVLLVDDDEDVRDAVADAVSTLGYAVRTASGAAQALALHADEPADIVLSDWTMPGLTGLELCSRLKAEDDGPYFILVSGFDPTDRLVEGMRAGADDFVRKPIDYRELEVRLLAASRRVQAGRGVLDQNAVLRRDSERSMQAARTDALTGIGNRRGLSEALEQAASNLSRYGHRCSVVMCDVDHFKKYNDRLGHLAGDAALQEVATALRLTLRVGDGVFRYGGEEFVAILPEQTATDAAGVAERLRAAVEALGIPRSEQTSAGVITISAGVADLRPDIHGSLARADAALYRAKRAGRNCVRCDGAVDDPLSARCGRPDGTGASRAAG